MLVCPAGAYCPLGSVAAKECPIGTFNDGLGKTALSDCQACPAEKYCENTGRKSRENLPSCEPGYYCKEGSFTARPGFIIDDPGTRVFGFCQEGQFCDGKSVEPEDCPPGTFNNLTHQSKCSTCPRGYFCGGAALMPGMIINNNHYKLYSS